jgi:hypothetical protein
MTKCKLSRRVPFSARLFLQLAAALVSANALACGPVQGTYVLKNRFAPDNTLEITRDGGGYRYSLGLNYGNQPNDGSLTSSGTAEGRLHLSNCQATGYDEDDECRFSFVFIGRGRVSIRQLDSCQTFGHNVNATGEYTRKGKP